MRPVIGTLLAVTLALVLASPASAQAPPPWKQGQPADLANSTLAPIAQPPAPAAASEIPLDKIKVPRGFKVSLWASGINNARAMVWGDNGTLFVSSRVAGNVYAVVDRGGRREVKVIAKGLNLPNGVAFKDGTLYVAEVSRITRMPGIFSNVRSKYEPRFPTPIIATRMVSLGDCAASSAGIATAVLITSRREYMLSVSCILTSRMLSLLSYKISLASV